MAEKILIRSIDRNSGSVQNGSLLLDEPIDGEWELLEFMQQNRYYNVNSYNQSIYVRVNDTTNSSVTLTAGHYSASQLCSQVSTQLSTIVGSTFTCTYPSATGSGKFTIAETTGDTFSFENATNDALSRFLLGFTAIDTSDATSHTSTNAIDLTPVKSMHVKFEEDCLHNIDGKNYFTSSFSINDESVFGENIRYRVTDNYRQIVKFRKTRNLKYKFFDENRNELEPNGTEWTMLLRKVN